MLHVESRPFEDADAHRFVELANRAFAHLHPGQRPRDDVRRVAHLHGAGNPAGRAWVALARWDGRVVGHASALPARYAALDGGRRIGWQIGYFVVDREVQRQGIGRGLVDALTTAMAARMGEFVFAFPNPRSAPVFERRGYVPSARVVSELVLGRRASRATAGEVPLPEGARARELDPHSARDVLEAIRAPRFERGGFVRDAARFAWRYLDPAVADAYRFARCVHPVHGEHVVAIAAHVYRGMEFGVLADAYPELTPLTLRAATSAAATFGPGRLVYRTTNIEAARGAFPEFSLRIPRRFDPRPVVPWVLPGGSVDAEELARAPTHTADWMAF